jgi:hypothetical protein
LGLVLVAKLDMYLVVCKQVANYQFNTKFNGEIIMIFIDKGLPLNDQGMKSVCTALGVTEVEVWAVLTVETRGFGFLKDRRPQILFERHVFHKQTNGGHDAGNADISNTKPGGYVGGSGEYPRLQKAIALDKDAALKSASWGIGQVMGFNHSAAGFATVDDMVQAMVKDENTQLLAMANFIKHKGLDNALQSLNWTAFALGYNGAGHQANNYVPKLMAAHAKYKVMLPDLPLRAAQAALLYIGFNPGDVDGVIGKRTRAALADFQEKFSLPETGDLDSVTEKKLFAQAF